MFWFKNLMILEKNVLSLSVRGKYKTVIFFTNYPSTMDILWTLHQPHPLAFPHCPEEQWTIYFIVPMLFCFTVLSCLLAPLRIIALFRIYFIKKYDLFHFTKLYPLYLLHRDNRNFSFYIYLVHICNRQ